VPPRALIAALRTDALSASRLGGIAAELVGEECERRLAAVAHLAYETPPVGVARSESFAHIADQRLMDAHQRGRRDVRTLGTVEERARISPPGPDAGPTD
jgi:hypothetical protein